MHHLNQQNHVFMHSFTLIPSPTFLNMLSLITHSHPSHHPHTRSNPPNHQALNPQSPWETLSSGGQPFPKSSTDTPPIKRNHHFPSNPVLISVSRLTAFTCTDRRLKKNKQRNKKKKRRNAGLLWQSTRRRRRKARRARLFLL